MTRLAPLLSLFLAACSGGDGGDGGDGAAAGASAGGTGGSIGSSGGAGGSAGIPMGSGGRPPSADGWVSAEGQQRIDCDSAASGPSVAIEGRALHFGYEQVGDNQNPIVALHDDGNEVWCERHETEGPDGRAVSVTWDGGDVAYVVFTVVGGGSALDGAADGWLDSYAPGAISGGGPKVSMVGQLDVASGNLAHGTFVIAVLSSNRVNTLRPEGPVTVMPDGRVEFRGVSAYAPLNPDKSRMECMGPSGFRYSVRFPADLSDALCARVTPDTGENDQGMPEPRSCVATTPCEP